MNIDSSGVRFVTDARSRRFVERLVVDLRDFYGEEQLYAYLPGARGC